MRIDRSYCSNQNTWPENHPQCIVVHNTDNFAAGADARAHARAQYQGNFQNMSAHYYVDDGEIAYQAAPHSRGCCMSGEIMEVKIYSADMETGTASRLRCACRKDMITKPHFYIRWSW